MIQNLLKKATLEVNNKEEATASFAVADTCRK
jgi:hypothetical protein